MSQLEFTEEVLRMAYADKPMHIRKGQAVFNYIEEHYGGVARIVQFIDEIDCFYNDDYIIPFINAVYDRITGAQVSY